MKKSGDRYGLVCCCVNSVSGREELISSNKYSFSANFHVLSCNAVIVLPQNTELIRGAQQAHKMRTFRTLSGGIKALKGSNRLLGH